MSIKDKIKIESAPEAPQENGTPGQTQNPPEEVKSKTSVEKVVSKKVTWQCKKRSYHVITNAIDKLAEKTRSGAFRKRVIKARNWRVDLDLNDPADLELHEYMLKHKDINHDYYLLADKGKNDKVNEEGQTLKSLMEMSIPQLMGCITDDELTEVGLMPNNCSKESLVMAIMRKKKLV